MASDDWDVRHPSSTEPRAELEPLLQCLLILVVGAIFNNDDIVALTDFATLLHLGLRLPLRLSLKSWGEGGTKMYFFTSSYNAKQA
jgi:hypothetical protein